MRFSSYAPLASPTTQGPWYSSSNSSFRRRLALGSAAGLGILSQHKLHKLLAGGGSSSPKCYSTKCCDEQEEYLKTCVDAGLRLNMTRLMVYLSKLGHSMYITVYISNLPTFPGGLTGNLGIQ